MQDLRSDLQRLIDLLSGSSFRYLTDAEARGLARVQATLIRRRLEAGVYAGPGPRPIVEALAVNGSN